MSIHRGHLTIMARLKKPSRTKRRKSFRLDPGYPSPIFEPNIIYDKNFDIVLPHGMYQDIYDFLFDNPSTEHLGVILAGVSEYNSTVKLLGRLFIPALPEDCELEHAGAVRARQSFSSTIMQLCAAEGLSQIDVHSHPFGPSPSLDFSSIDDIHEAELAEYIYTRLPHTWYSSLVLNQGYFTGRIWLGAQHCGSLGFKQIRSLTLAGSPLIRSHPTGRDSRAEDISDAATNTFVSRQVLAFGAEGQARLQNCTVGIIGAGGLGSILIEGLARLGVEKFQVVDPDVAEITNLNRVVGMTHDDINLQTPKVEISKRVVTSINPKATISCLQNTLFCQESIDLLKTANVLFVATDNHSTRMVAQAIATQYLLPLISTGVNISLDDMGELVDVSGEVVVSLPGPAGFCLKCLNRYNPVHAALELSQGADRARIIRRGYIESEDIPAPSVRHLNGVVADLAIVEFHNLLSPFKAPALWLEYDQLKSIVTHQAYARAEDCTTCSPFAKLGLGDLEPISRLFKVTNESDLLSKISTVYDKIEDKTDTPDIVAESLPCSIEAIDID